MYIVRFALGSDTTARSTGGARVRHPDQRETPQHVRARDPVHPHVQERRRVQTERSGPLVGE